MQDWIKHKVFSAAEVQILCWVYITWGADDLYWDSSCECQHHQVASELPPSLKLVWNSSELLCSVNYAHKCPGVQLGRLAGAGLMDLREESESSFRLSWNGILTWEFIFSSRQPEIVGYLHINYCWMPRLQEGYAFLIVRLFWRELRAKRWDCSLLAQVRALTATLGNAGTGVNYGTCGKVEVRRKLPS